MIFAPDLMMIRLHLLLAALIAAPILPCPANSLHSVEETARAIREETLRQTTDADGFPLPLTSTFQIGKYRFAHPYPDRPRGSDPDWQIERIEKGHYFLPCFDWPQVDYKEEQWAAYFYPAFEKLRQYRLPFVFMGSQWEGVFTAETSFLGISPDSYSSLPPEATPLLVTPEGEILRRIDPFGPTEIWRELGKRLTSENPILTKLQELYPEPPRIFFNSNNEAPKLRWPEIEQSKRYMEKYGPGKSDAFKRKVIADAWIEKYRALQAGMREGLRNQHWRKNAVFTAYSGDVGTGGMGRWPGWVNYSLHSPGRPDPTSFMWDGIDYSYYMNNWSQQTDYSVQSNQIEAMNQVFALNQTRKANPDYHFNIIVWDGDSPNPKTGSKPKLTVYREAGQTYDMARYRGWLQYGMWLLRPRSMRLYENWTTPLEDFEEKLKNIERITDLVHDVPTLRQWWRRGELVANRKQAHPYQLDIPGEIAIQPRWFLLHADVNPPQPWKLNTEIPVFSLALRQGESPNRQWLIYTHAPLRDYKSVKIEIPEWKAIRIDVPREGAFYEVQESDGSVTEIPNSSIKKS